MNFDIILILLGFIVILIFSAIFTLLRSMNSPFIKRFEMVVGGKMEPLANKINSYFLKFKMSDRDFELYEIQHEVGQKKNKVYNKYVFLKASTTSDLLINFKDVVKNQNVGNLLFEFLDDTRNDNRSPGTSPCADVYFEDLKVYCNNVDKVKMFLKDEKIYYLLSDSRRSSGGSTRIPPFFFEKNAIVLDYRLSERYLKELINNPRTIKKHVTTLCHLASAIESFK